MTEIFYVLSGLFAGVAAGMGMGGGTILIPMLTLLCGMGQHMAQGVNVAAFVPAAIAALVIHRREGRVSFGESVPIILAGICGAVAASLLAGGLKDEWLKSAFAIFILASAVARTVTGEIKRARAKADGNGKTGKENDK